MSKSHRLLPDWLHAPLPGWRVPLGTLLLAPSLSAAALSTTADPSLCTPLQDRRASVGVGPTLGADPDSDGDGLSDFQERHKYFTDPERSDSDGDGTPDGDWEERREFSYTVRTRVRVMRPVDPLAACDDYQDARVLDESPEWVELEVVHYPLGTAAEAVEANAGWRAELDVAAAYLEPTTTSTWDEGMRGQLHDELREAGIDLEGTSDLELASAAARRLMERSEFADGFTTFYVDFRRGQPVVPKSLARVIERHEEESGRSIEEQWERELFARGMFEHRVHGSCTSSAIYLCGGLRAAGIPARIVLVIPIVDVNDPHQLHLVERGIRHHRVRDTVLRGLGRLGGGWISHTFNEVWVGGRWRRLNYARMGQPTLDAGLYGLTTHVLTVRDWSDARFARTVGERQGLGERDEVFRTANPYATLELDDRFGEHAALDNPPPPEPEGLARVELVDAVWVSSDRMPAGFEVSGVDMETDRHHLLLVADPAVLEQHEAGLEGFWERSSKGFVLRAEASEEREVAARAVRGWWWGKEAGVPYLYFILRLSDGARAALEPGESYLLEPTARWGVRFTVREGLAVRVPG